MIHRTFSSLQSFKAMTFGRGLNIVVSDKSPGASDRQTRNGAGKSSLVELVHFLMGATCDPDSIFREDALSESTFGIELDLKGSVVRVERSGSESSKVESSGDTNDWPVQPKLEKKSGRMLLKNSDWKLLLGHLIFNLSVEADEAKYRPSFRSLFSYFVRRASNGGMLEPVQQSSKQQTWDQQVAVSYLVGFDWTIPQAWQQLRDREDALDTLRKGASAGLFGELIGKAADLRTKLTLAEDRLKQKQIRIDSFRVLPDYHDLEREASTLTRQINDLTNQNALDRQLLSELQTAIASEAPPPIIDLDALYREVGVVLPDVAVRRFEDVRKFHESVVSNRKTYLSQEITEAEQRITVNSRSQAEMVDRRAEIFNVLKTGGALEQYTQLQGELTKLRTEVETLRQRLQTAEALETGHTELKIERARLLTRLRQDHHEQEALYKEAILAYENMSGSLYEKPGVLTISQTESGPKFNVTLEREKSKGINNMRIFCFDWMLAQLCASRGMGPGFLVHDSHLFDGSDERQVAKALEIGARTAERIGWQYIVTMNSDVLPQSFSTGKHIVKPKLMDTEKGGVFGIRFG